jgi:CRP-like cAMP-binding protein
VPLAIQSVKAGDVLGVSWMFEPYRWAFTARATRFVTAIEIAAGPVRERCREDPIFGNEILWRFAQLFASRLQATRRRLLDYLPIS